MASGGILTYNPDRYDEYIEAVGAVLTLNQIAAYCRTPQSTFKDWIKEGQKDILAGLDTPLARLSAGVKQEQSKCVKRYLAELSVGTTNWQSRSWILERAFADDFGVHAAEYRELREEFVKLREHFEGKK